ncbi:MAG: ATP-binding protein [Candidatus Limisoma sp.]
MEREAIKLLYEWKSRTNRKPLVIRGARQVGKTWLMLEFARKAYDKWIYINFEDEEVLKHVFEPDFNIERILEAISLRFHTEVDANTLLIFDEIQAAPRGITSLKYFYEKAPEYHIITAGSLLGVSMHRGDSFPVGKVDFVSLYPMNFMEFLRAAGEEGYARIIEESKWESIAYVKDRIVQLLRTYYFVGGMPEAVKAYCDGSGYEEVRRIQSNILLSYENDLSKHAPTKEVPRIRMVWQSIMSQLAKENRKFIYGVLRQGSRAKEFEVAVEWLRDAGLIYKVNRTKSGEMPLSAFEDFGSFKLFMLDVGLMCTMNKLPADSILLGNEVFLSYRGAMTEQYVCQQLMGTVDSIYYWSADNSRGEIDFLIQKGDRIIAIEVKAEENLKAKSLSAFVARYPSLYAVRLSMSDYREQDWMDNVPLYAACCGIETKVRVER